MSHRGGLAGSDCAGDDREAGTGYEAIPGMPRLGDVRRTTFEIGQTGKGRPPKSLGASSFTLVNGSVSP